MATTASTGAVDDEPLAVMDGVAGQAACCSLGGVDVPLPLLDSSFEEQYLFNVFEVIVSTLESKLQRIENLDRAVEHLMRRVEALDSRVNDNIDKTDSIIEKLRTFDLKLFQGGTLSQVDNNLSERLVSLDQKVSDIDNKLVVLKNQLDSNFLPADDINAEASEKKPISMNVLDITKVLSSELDSLRSSTSNVDRKLQFHINLVSENLGKILSMMSDVHEAVVEPVMIQTGPPQVVRNRTSTTPTTTIIKNSKLDKLVRQMHPILSVSNKMDEVWDVVVGTKTSVDDLVPKSDELLTQTQRQERAISNIHDDLRTNTNKIIANLDMVEKRLKKQENDVVTLAQRPVPAELLLDPTIDRIVEFDQNRFQDTNDPTLTEPPPPVTFTTPTTQGQTIPSTTPSVITAAPGVLQGVQPGRSFNRNRGVIFPSVKNKPLPANNTFATDFIPNIKDVKVSNISSTKYV
ncbi:Fibrinogen- domains (FReDs) [Homalodisca vitripennis]|nr:Fibrinogen- domains (FReDs) [Homalodisca vitripennis]